MLLIIAQVVGIAAVALYLLSFQLKKRMHIVLANSITNCLYVLQYILLGAFSGAVMDFLAVVSSFLAGKKNTPGFRRYATAAAIVLSILILGTGLALAIAQKDWLELLPIAGALLQTNGLWFNREQTIRKFALTGAPFWLVYNFLAQAYGAAVGTLFTMISIVIALLRYRKPEQTESV